MTSKPPWAVCSPVCTNDLSLDVFKIYIVHFFNLYFLSPKEMKNRAVCGNLATSICSRVLPTGPLQLLGTQVPCYPAKIEPECTLGYLSLSIEMPQIFSDVQIQRVNHEIWNSAVKLFMTTVKCKSPVISFRNVETRFKIGQCRFLTFYQNRFLLRTFHYLLNELEIAK